MYKIVGIDLAGLEKNETGFCVLEDKNALVKILHTNQEIIGAVESEGPGLVCIDGPTTLPKRGMMRQCDADLKEYGVLPPLLGGMRYLTLRANKLREQLEQKYEVIEVFPTATAKILGFYDPNPIRRQKSLLALGVTGDTEKRLLTKDEVDAIAAAITGWLYKQGKARKVGNEDGTIVVPVV